MANPKVSYPITITGGSSMVGEVIVENISKDVEATNSENNKLRVDLDSNKKATVDLANLESGYNNGDTIEIRVTGIRSGNAVHTVDTSKGSAKVTLAQTTSNYSGASISL
jgi:hypothetical protein